MSQKQFLDLSMTLLFLKVEKQSPKELEHMQILLIRELINSQMIVKYHIKRVRIMNWIRRRRSITVPYLVSVLRLKMSSLR
jgi:hypothetical protein